MQPTRLVLFDIDGTLLHGGPLWKESFLSALNHYFPDLQFPKVPFGGKTDLQICRELLLGVGFGEHEITESLRKVVELYVEKATVAAQSRAHEVKILPGVVELLDRLQEHKNVFLGLLTGNVREGAKLKLQCANLHDYFAFGVYGDDNWDRYQLPSLAVKRIHENHKLTFAGKQIVIIGDTVHDINCGKSIGVRSIAVGTGRMIPTEDLLAQNPDFYFKDLSSTADVIQAILDDYE